MRSAGVQSRMSHSAISTFIDSRSGLSVTRRYTCDPTAHLNGGRGADRTLLPMTAEEIGAVQQAAVTPAQRLAIALAAVHAARPRAIRELTLDDLDLPSRRIILAGHLQPLGELARIALLAWLDGLRRCRPQPASQPSRGRRSLSECSLFTAAGR